MQSELYFFHLQEVHIHFQNALEKFELDQILIPSGDKQYFFRDDLEYPFKSNPYFNYWIPFLNRAYIFLLIKKGKAPQCIIIEQKSIWEKEETIHFEQMDYFDFQFYADKKTLWKDLKLENVLILGENNYSKVHTEKADKIKSLYAYIDYKRSFKSEFEIENIKKANEIAAVGHSKSKDLFYSGASEFEIHLEYLKSTFQLENETPYPNIVGLNEHAAILHYHQKEIKKSENLSMLIDAGVQFNSYNSDITRTYTTKRDSIFQNLINELDAAQQAIEAEIVVGKSFINLHESALYSIAELLRNFDIVRLDPDEIIEKKIIFHFLPHGLGHSLGLQVHDSAGWIHDENGKEIKPEGDYKYLRMTRILEEGMVFTIEPGLYCIPSLMKQLEESKVSKSINWKLLKELSSYGGIRIEDNIVIQKGTVRNLTREAFDKAEIV